MFFKPIRPEKVRADQLYEAKRLLLEHAAAAEHHQALADMYEARIQRLEGPFLAASVGPVNIPDLNTITATA